MTLSYEVLAIGENINYELKILDTNNTQIK